jgi:hypothetical protein
MPTMWKFALTLILALMTAVGAAAAAGSRGWDRGAAAGWHRAQDRGWQRDESQGQGQGQGKYRRDRREAPRGASPERRGNDGRDWRGNPRRQRVQDNYRSPYRSPSARPPARDPRLDRGRRYNPDQGGRDRARDAYRRGKIVSLDRVMTVVQRRYRGRVLDVRLDERRLIYHLRVLTRGGRVLRIAVDARNARVLSAQGGGQRR